MSSVDSVRTTKLPVATGAAFVIFCGLALSWLVVNAPPYMVVVAFLGIAFCIIFLQRPDLGLLMVLLVRASSDISVWLMGAATDVSGIRAVLLTPNVGLVLMVVLCGSFYMLIRKVPFISLPGGILLVLFQLTGIVAMLHSPGMLRSLDQWLSVTSTFIVYALTAYLFRTPSRIQGVIDVLAASFVVPAAFGFLQLAGQAQGRIPDLGISRIQGTFVHPSSFGFYLVLILSVFITQAIAQSGWRRLLALLIVGASLVLIAETYARAAWVGTVIVLLTAGLLGRRAVLIFTLIGLVAVSALAPSLVARVRDPKQSASLEDRYGLWRGSLLQWQSETAVDGSTFGTVLNRVAGLGPGSVAILTSRFDWRGTMAAHNDYLRIFIEYGVFGLALYFLLICVLVIFAYRTWRSSTDKIMRSTALSFLGVALAFPAMFLTDNLFGQTANQIFFWALGGLTVAISRIPGRQGNQSGASIPQRAGPLALPQALV